MDKFIIFSAIMFLLPITELAAESNIEELRAKCDAARERLIAPKREQAVKNCIETERKSQDYCERFYSDYGDGGKVGSRVRQPMFSDIPECTAVQKTVQKAQASKRDTNDKGVCGRARSINPAGENPVPARQVSHRVANIGQAEVTPNVKHGGRKATGRKRKLK